jgi:hypothetical protein
VCISGCGNVSLLDYLVTLIQFFPVLVSELWSQGVRVFHFLELLGVSDLVVVSEGNAGILCV